MKIDKVSALKWGLGFILIGLSAYTVNYVMKQIRLLAKTKFDVVGTALNKISSKEISITLWWKVVNSSDISFVVKNQVYDIYLNDRFVKKVGYADPVEVLANGTSRIPTYISVSPKELLNIGLMNIGDLATKEGREKTKLKVVGSFVLETSIKISKKIPFEYSDTLGNIMK